MPVFVTAINCINGRGQSPVSTFLKTLLRADYVDMITCPGPVAVLTKNEDSSLIRYLHDSVMMSVSEHRSEFVAVVAHHDCAANNLSETEQRAQIATSINRIHQWQVPVQIVGLWVNSNWVVEIVTID